MASCLDSSHKLQEYASIGIPGEWITDDDNIPATITKIGGFAKYFYLWHKTREQIECLSCNQKMYLLTQINAPLFDQLIQRNIYVFMCCNSKCTKTNKGWKVIIQRGPKMDYNHYSKNKDNNNNNNNHNNNNIRKIIKKNNKNHCAKKKKHSKNGFESFWNNALNHNKNGSIETKMNGLNDDFARLMAMQQKLLNEVEIKKEKKTKKKNKLKINNNFKNNKKQSEIKKGCFVPFEIEFNDEGYFKNGKNYKNNKILKWKNKEIDLNKFIMNENQEKEEEEEKEDNDDLLSDYLERISFCKNQCIRYNFGDNPLIPNKINLDKIPNCKHCGNKKVFEFQIMSITLNYLQPKQIDHDWLSVLIFVCPLSCQQSDDEQYVIVCCE